MALIVQFDEKRNQIFHEIEAYSLLNDTDISSHLPSLYKACIFQLQKNSNSGSHLLVELGYRQFESTYVFNQLGLTDNVYLVRVEPTDPNSELSSRYSEATGNVQSHFYELDYLSYGKLHAQLCSGLGIPSPIDLLFIDSDHTYEHTLKELKRFVPLLSPNGMLILHDTNMCPLPNYGWHLRNGRIMSGGWDNQRGVARALATYFRMNFDETADFCGHIIFNSGLQNNQIWLVDHDSICNGLTIFQKADLIPNRYNKLIQNTVIPPQVPVPVSIPVPVPVPASILFPSLSPSPVLSILIYSSIDSSKSNKLKQLIDLLNAQLVASVEVWIGDQRQDLLDRARGDYIVYIDEGDLVPDYYVSSILKAIGSRKPDVIGFICYYSAPDSSIAVHTYSIKYSETTRFADQSCQGPPIHLNPMRRKLALKVGTAYDTRDLLSHLKTEYFIPKVMYLSESDSI